MTALCDLDAAALTGSGIAFVAESVDPQAALRRHPDIFRQSLKRDNRMCLCSFMAAEYDDLPDAVKIEVLTFTDINVAWLAKLLSAASMDTSAQNEQRARATFAAVAVHSWWPGAAPICRSKTRYRAAGLLPA